MKKSPVRKPDTVLTVQAPEQLLPFLLLHLAGHSRNNIKSLLTHREVFVDHAVVTKHDYPLEVGQEVTVNWSLVRDSGKTSNRRKDPEELAILYEDRDIIVVNKPAGLLCIATDKREERTAYRLLMEHVRDQNPKNRVFIVHRLDRDTSGIMMIAKSQEVQRTLQDNWDENLLERGYIAAVEGKVTNPSGRVHSWLKETKTHVVYCSDVAGEGLEAITNYRLIDAGKHYSLVALSLETGRKNQIRVQMKEIGHSIAGDKKYAALTDPLHRLCLHAHILEFKHPVTKEVMRFEAEIPKAFSSLLLK